MNARRMMALLMLTVLFALAGCGGGTTTTNSSPSTTGPKTTDQVTKDPIVIAGVIGLSGRLTELGKQDQFAMEVVAEQINASGGVLGRPVKLVYYDEAAKPQEIAQKIMDDNVFALVGWDSSGNALAWYPEIMKMKKIMMVSGAGSPDVTAAVSKDPQTNRYLFRNGNHARDWARTAAVYLREIQKAKTYFYLSQDNAFGKSLEPILSELVKTDGISQVGSAYFPVEGTNFDAAFKAIEQAKPDVIVSYIGVSGYAFAKHYNEKKIGIPMFDIAANSYELEDKVKAELGNKADHIALTIFAADVPITSKTKPFYSAYKAKAGGNPAGLFDVRAGDAISILAEAITQAGAVDNDKVISILEQKTFTGTAGIYEFDSSHQAKWGPSHLSGLIGQWQNGKLEIIWPAQTRTATYLPAPWWSTAVARK